MQCKSYSHFFSKKFQHICVSLDVNFNELLTNNVVSFEQLGPDGKVHEHSAYWENISADNLKYFLVFFFFFFRKICLDISCRLSPLETMCMKFQSLFSGKNMKYIVHLSSAEFAQSMLSVKISKY